MSDHIFQRLCHEAVLACGDDLAAVERYVTVRLEHLDTASLEAVKQDLDRVLAYRAPRKPAPWLQ